MQKPSVIGEGIQHYLNAHDLAGAALLARAIHAPADVVERGCAALGGPHRVRSASEDQLVQAFGEQAAEGILAWRRFNEHTSEIPRGLQFRSSRDVAGYLMARAEGLSHERVWLLSLDAKQRLLSTSVIADGSSSSANVDIRATVRMAVHTDAVGVVLAHNHPSGDVTPSPDDIKLTTQLREAFSAVGVSLVDHVIVSATKSYSMLDNGLAGLGS